MREWEDRARSVVNRLNEHGIPCSFTVTQEYGDPAKRHIKFDPSTALTILLAEIAAQIIEDADDEDENLKATLHLSPVEGHDA